MTKDTIKLAGPDSANTYRVLATKGTLMVKPGELYTESYVQNTLLDERTKRRVDTSIIQPKYDSTEAVSGRRFRGTPVK